MILNDTLMLGDCISSRNEFYNLQVTGLRAGDDCITCEYYDNGGKRFEVEVNESDIIPIPLTREIIFNLGFTMTSQATHSQVYINKEIDDMYGLLTIYVNKDDTIYITFYNENNMIDILKYSIKYVHELQHILKELGIPKEFFNFNI